MMHRLFVPFAVAALAAAFAVSSCSSSATVCSASTCADGCCAADGTCVKSAGQSTSSCGVNGQQCAACSTGQVCMAGSGCVSGGGGGAGGGSATGGGSSTGGGSATGGGGGGSGDFCLGDAGLPADAGYQCTTHWSSCSNYVDLSNGEPDGGPAAIDWTSLFTAAPGCVSVKAGQTLTFFNVSTLHPLDQSCGAANVSPVEVTTAHTVSFPCTGHYGFYCSNHGSPGGTGMVLEVEVKP